MAVTFNNLVNDSGGNTDGTLIDKAQFQLLLMGAVVASTSTGAQNNWAPGLDGHTLIEWAGASDAAITGLATGTAGQIAMIRNTGTKVATFAHLSGSSSAANQFSNSATSGVTPVASSGSVIYRHDGTNWKLIAHEQGDWITPTFDAAHYTGAGSMTWTLTSPDRSGGGYWLRGRHLTVYQTLDTTTVGGTLSQTLQVDKAAYGGFTASAIQFSDPIAIAADAGVNVEAYLQVNASGTLIRIIKKSLAVWSAATNTTSVYFKIVFGVT
jgi:hypothetical protein